MKELWDLLTRVPEWAAKIGFLIVALIIGDMYIRSATAFYFGDTSVGFLNKDQLRSDMIWSKDPVTKANYPNGTHINTSQSANCPEGSVVTGVTVVYGGTCHSQCDGDGGVVRQLELVCRRLVTDVPPRKESAG